MLDHDDRKPETSGDKFFIVVFTVALLVLFGLEIADQFSPAKSGAILFIFFWVPMLVLHEFGHAMMAKFFGWKLNEIVLGFGATVYSFNALGTIVKVNKIPLEGFVNCEPGDAPYSNFKHALIYFAGPGIELIVVALIGAYLGFDNLFKPATSYSVIALQSCAYAALVGAVMNLIPMSVRHGDGYSLSDGAGILACLFGGKRQE